MANNLPKKKITFLITAFCGNSLFCFSQINPNSILYPEKGDTVLFEKIKNADSIVLAEHSTPYEYAPKIVEDYPISKAKSLKRKIADKNATKLLINNKLNNKIIRKKVCLTLKQKEKLVEIFGDLSTNKFMYIQIPARCFDPHNGIFIYKQNKISFLEICFGCHETAASKDVSLMQYFSFEKWKQIEKLFNISGLQTNFEKVEN